MGSSNDWTLSRVRAQVRAQASVLSIQESGELDSMLNDKIHQSILSVRSALDVLVEDEYRITSSNTTVPGTFSTSSSGYTDNSGDAIAAGIIFDLHPSKLSLFGLTQFVGEIPIFSKAKFDALRSIYRTNTEFPVTKGIATVYSTTSGTVIVAVYGNPTATTAPTFDFTYLRQPTRETTDGNTVDIPDKWVPLVIDHCTAELFKSLKGTIPGDVEARMKSSVVNIAKMLQANLNPQTVR